jgi:excisionase family DNA binding protein
VKRNPKTHLAGKAPTFDPLLDLKEAADYIGRHPSTLRRAVKAREIACVRGSSRYSHIRIRLSDLNAWVKGQLQPARRLLDHG